MYILPCVLALLSLLPAGPLSAAEPGIKILVGVWRGSLTTMPDGCVWKVRLSVKEQLGAARGSFSSSGPCAKGRSTGTFLSQPGEPGCYTMDAGIPSMPKVPLKGCFDESGDLIFDSPMYNGALKFSEAGRKAALDIKSMLGSVSGNFKKLGKPPAARSGKKENKNAKSVKKSSGEIYVGGH